MTAEERQALRERYPNASDDELEALAVRDKFNAAIRQAKGETFDDATDMNTLIRKKAGYRQKRSKS